LVSYNSSNTIVKLIFASRQKKVGARGKTKKMVGLGLGG